MSAEGWRWFVEALMQVLVIPKGALIDKHGVHKALQSYYNSGLLLMFTMLTAVCVTIWHV